MVTRDPGEPRAAVVMLPFLLGFAAGEWLGGFIAGLLIAQCKKWGGAGGWGIDGYRAGTYDVPSKRSDFYEDDEPVDKIVRAFRKGKKGLTKR